MDKIMSLIPYYFINTLSFKGMLGKPLFTFSLVGLLVAFTELTMFQQSLFLLLLVTVIDFITGIYASYLEVKKKANLIKGTVSIKVKFGIFIEAVESKKLRESAAKTVVYLLLVILSYIIEKIAVIKPFNFESVSEAHYTLSTLAAGFCILVELWSIFLENLPKCGFDIVKTFTKAFTKAKQIKKDLTED